MTLDQIGTMLRLARVPRSKTVECFYPNPRCIVHVPASHVHIVRDVIARLTLPGQNVRATLLESNDVATGQHVYVKVKGDAGISSRLAYESLPAYRDRCRLMNRNIVIECATVNAQ